MFHEEFRRNTAPEYRGKQRVAVNEVSSNNQIGDSRAAGSRFLYLLDIYIK